MSAVTHNGDPADPRLAHYLPPGVLAAQQRAREDAADVKQWRAYDLQWQVFHRLRELSANHATQAWRRRYRASLAAYALAYLFTQPARETTPGAGRITEVHAATRVWKAGTESQRPIPLLAKLIQLARSRDPRLVWDMREDIANRSDPGMAEGAVYLGLGLSSLDTATGTWAQVCQNASNELDIPGTILYVSTSTVDPADPNPADQQVIIADRRGANDRNVTTIHTHRGLSDFQRSSAYPFAEVDLNTLYRDSGHGHLLWAMHDLDVVLHQADRHRRTMEPVRRENRRRPS